MSATSSSEVYRSYYYAGGQRVAMRERSDGSDEITYLLNDHLNSTSLATDASGAVTAEIRYTAFGADRYASGAMPTSYRYTGQRLDADTDMYICRLTHACITFS